MNQHLLKLGSIFTIMSVLVGLIQGSLFSEKHSVHDPDNKLTILLASGQVYWYGRVTLSRVSAHPSGIVSAGEGGDTFSLEVLDQTGGVLHATAFGVVFRKMSDTPTRTSVAPFNHVLPYPDQAVFVQIRRGVFRDKKLIGAALLRTAISDISDNQFGENGRAKRSHLLEKINAYEAAFVQGRIPKAKEILENDILSTVKSLPTLADVNQREKLLSSVRDLLRRL